MTNSIKNIIFDFDGTLADTAPLIVATMQAAIKELDLAPQPEAVCRATIGLRLEEIPALLWPGNSVAREKFATTYRRIFDELKRPLAVECFPGVTETLRALHGAGFRMAMASSRSHKSLSEYVSTFGLDDCFSMLIGGNDVSRGKPAPEPVEKILNTCGWDAKETLTVGDAPVDILMGHAAGTLTCAVTYGNGQTAELQSARPTYIIDSFYSLPAILGCSKFPIPTHQTVNNGARQD